MVMRIMYLVIHHLPQDRNKARGRSKKDPKYLNFEKKNWIK